MLNHTTLLQLFEKLGYLNTGGLCLGFSIRWIEASLLGKEALETFVARIHFLDKYQNELDEKIKEARTKVQAGYPLNEEEQQALEVIPFFDSMALYQEDYKYVVGTFFSQSDIERKSLFAASQAIEDQGGLTLLCSQTGIYDDAALRVYLTELAAEIDQIEPKQTIGIEVGNHNHSIALSYSSKNKTWHAMDINQYLPLSPQSDQNAQPVENIVRLLKQGFEAYSSTDKVALTVQLITTGNNPSLPQLLERLTAFRAVNYKTKLPHLSIDTSGTTLLFMASMANDIDLLNLILSRDSQFINTATSTGLTPLYVASQRSHTKIIKLLLKNNAEMHLALYGAAQHGHTKIVQLLLKNGATVDQTIPCNATPLIVASQNGHTETIQLLLRNGSDINHAMDNGTTALNLAAQNGHTGTVRLLLENGSDINQAMHNGTTPLFIAAKLGRTETVRLLLEYKAEVNTMSDGGVTPLFMAVQNGHTEIVRLLLKNGADINKEAPNGATPLFVAAYNGYMDTVYHLLTAPDLDIERTFQTTKSSWEQLTNDEDKSIKQRMQYFLSTQNTEQVAMKPADIAWVMHGWDAWQKLCINKLHTFPELWNNPNFIRFYDAIEAHHHISTIPSLSAKKNEFEQQILELTHIRNRLCEEADQGNRSYQGVAEKLEAMIEALSSSGTQFFNAPTHIRLTEFQRVLAEESSTIKPALLEHCGNECVRETITALKILAEMTLALPIPPTLINKNTTPQKFIGTFFSPKTHSATQFEPVQENLNNMMLQLDELLTDSQRFDL
ncbi:ankyrin repeat domain-containing protein [uncultured Legionella sp.]|uniref:ankyrin repeat domain-containing protein n=1 Tax=uncultured Legionella sp. TaxID=210934 RepID=UPI0026020774|nr:ankyrin repeat domain-containing protein [uncultured Legionella sp.]